MNQVTITYHEYSSPWGNLLIASNDKGICFLAIETSLIHAEEEMRERLRGCVFLHEKAGIHTRALNYITDPLSQTAPPLSLHGTPFQLRVWEALMSIPYGKTVCYGHIAQQIGKPKATRAVGTAIGKNPVSIIIPCHRVVHADGSISNYHWGVEIKRALLDKESGGKYPSEK